MAFIGFHVANDLRNADIIEECLTILDSSDHTK